MVATDPDDPTQPSGQLYYLIEQNNPDAKTFAIGTTQIYIITEFDEKGAKLQTIALCTAASKILLKIYELQMNCILTSIKMGYVNLYFQILTQV